MPNEPKLMSYIAKLGYKQEVIQWDPSLFCRKAYRFQELI